MGYKKTFTSSSLARTATILGAAALGATSAVCIALSGEKAANIARRNKKLSADNAHKNRAVPRKSDEEIALEVERELAATQLDVSDKDSFLGKIECIFSEK